MDFFTEYHPDFLLRNAFSGKGRKGYGGSGVNFFKQVYWYYFLALHFSVDFRMQGLGLTFVIATK